MNSALARHDAILKAAVESEGGFVVKTTGDGLHAAFPSAIDGVKAVLASQLALISEQWGSTGQLRVRMALHSGEAELRDGDFMVRLSTALPGSWGRLQVNKSCFPPPPWIWLSTSCLMR